MREFPRKSDPRRGFTLLELSIVLVIIGLIVGAILGGAQLVESYRMRAVAGEIEKFIGAFNTFKIKFGYLAGDFPRAEDVWGADAGCPATPTNTVRKRETCNGTGSGTVAGALAEFYETYRAWQHLSNAEMIEGAYTGVAGPGGATDSVLGLNVPGSKWPSSFYEIWYSPLSAGDANYYPAKYGHFFLLTGEGGILTPLEAYELDVKLDDGKPGYGKVITARPAVLPNCADDADPAVALYDTATMTPTCVLIILTGL